MEDEYNSIIRIQKVKINIQRSIFYGISLPILKNPSDILNSIKKEYLSASHYCWAYRIFPSEEHYSDGGEPSGTAGKPILNALREFNLWDAMVIVVRYFGGIKLGIKGLINAYYVVAREAIRLNDIIKKEKALEYNLIVSYDNFPHLKNEILRNFSLEIKEEFGEEVILNVKIPESKKEAFEKYLLEKEGMGIVKRN